jgi:hypothetical protein
MTVSEYDLEHPMPMHRAVAAFIQDEIDQSPSEFTGAFSYRISVERRDRSSEPFIYRTDEPR